MRANVEFGLNENSHFLKRLRMKLPVPIALASILISGLISIGLAFLATPGFYEIGFSQLEWFGWISIVLLAVACVFASMMKIGIWWVVAAALLQALGLCVDSLDLLIYGKALLALTLVALGQWFALEIRVKTVSQRLIVGLLFANGILIQAIYYSALFRHKNVVRFF